MNPAADKRILNMLLDNQLLMKTEPTSVCAIILAYGARTEQLHKVFSSIMEQGVGHVIIVANAVITATHQILYDLKDIYPGQLEILSSNENLGSAGGYALGLNTAFKKSYEYFWLLDDDNLPREGALAALLDAFSIHRENTKKSELVLQSFRESQPEMIDIIYKGCQPSTPRPASFIGFHVLNLWESISAMLPMARHIAAVDLDAEKKIIRLNWAPYGGLFFHRDAIKTLGLPNSLFFLYADDLAYTLNFTSHGGNLFMVPGSRIVDIEPVWNATGGKASNLYRRLKLLSPVKTYYEVRNRIYIGRTMFPGNLLMYLLNKWLYIFVLSLFALYYRCGDRFKLIMRAINDGESGQLGKRNFDNET